MKNLFPIIFSFLLLFNFSAESIIAQSNDSQLWNINRVKIDPADREAYELAGIKGTEALKAANVSNTFYITHGTDQYEYFISMPIKNMAELDKSFWAEAVSKLGVEKLTELMAAYEGKIKESKLEIYRQLNELDYEHSSLNVADLNFRSWTIYECKPNKQAEVYAVQKAWLDLFKKHNIVRKHMVFEGLIGTKSNTFVLVEFAKDRETQAKQQAELLKKGGEELQALWKRTEALILSTETITGRPIHDMSIYPPVQSKVSTAQKE